MPNRMIRDWTDSLRMDGITAAAERLFIRLIMKADDYGRFHSDHRLVKASCFPLADDISPADVGPWLSELANSGLIVLYEVDGRKALAIANYGQRLRTSRAKFPQMAGEGSDWLPMFNEFPRLADNCPRLPATSSNPPPEEKPKRSRREHETETETEVELAQKKPDKTKATLQEVVEFMQSVGLQYSDAEYIFHSWQANGWTRNGKPIKSWTSQIHSWKSAGYFPSQKNAKKDSGFTLDQVGMS